MKTIKSHDKIVQLCDKIEAAFDDAATFTAEEEIKLKQIAQCDIEGDHQTRDRLTEEVEAAHAVVEAFNVFIADAKFRIEKLANDLVVMTRVKINGRECYAWQDSFSDCAEAELMRVISAVTSKKTQSATIFGPLNDH